MLLLFLYYSTLKLGLVHLPAGDEGFFFLASCAYSSKTHKIIHAPRLLVKCFFYLSKELQDLLATIIFEEELLFCCCFSTLYLLRRTFDGLTSSKARIRSS